MRCARHTSGNVPFEKTISKQVLPVKSVKRRVPRDQLRVLFSNAIRDGSAYRKHRHRPIRIEIEKSVCV